MEDLRSNVANSCPLTPLGFLDRAATVYGDCDSVVYNDITYTWSQTRSRCLRLASALSSVLSISPGDVVSVVAPNIPAVYEMHFGVPMSGAVLNTLNIRLDARTLAILLHHSKSKLVFVDHEYVDLVGEVFFLIESQGHMPPLLIPILENKGEVLNSNGPKQQLVMAYEDLIVRGDPDFTWVRPKHEWMPMVLNYTSGTTSTPKGVVHCHRGLYLATIDSLLNWSVPKQPVYLWTLPMFHSNGWCFPWGVAAQGGVNICLRRFDAVIIYSAIRRHNVTHMCCAPVVLNMLANLHVDDHLSLHKHNPAVHVMTAAASPPPSILMRIEELGFSVSHGYGLTETAGIVLSCEWKRKWNKFPASDRARLKSRQGIRTVGTNSIDVVNPNTAESVMRDGTALGEVVVRGASIMLGYFKDEEATSKAMRRKENDPGWFYTGDLAVMHKDGYIEIKDRSKDVIISGGENISSVEVESLIYTHPYVKEAAVVAMPDEFWGESPCGFVILKEEKVAGEKEMIAFCRDRLPHFMAPKRVVFMDGLPKTSTGKIEKLTLREIAKTMVVKKKKKKPVAGSSHALKVDPMFQDGDLTSTTMGVR